ncbi:hypothetical protein JKP88DRAFT_249215 [Tribonema minus]|uniref:Uncharacterized protein n=1 Tax=Tribonema minus TaxID=303371 RepID=A0A835YUI7_9STRA|nr:hypothetical protein JKP88DRAFT_249215 [Tribonema minus]
MQQDAQQHAEPVCSGICAHVGSWVFLQTLLPLPEALLLLVLTGIMLSGNATAGVAADLQLAIAREVSAQLRCLDLRVAAVERTADTLRRRYNNTDADLHTLHVSMRDMAADLRATAPSRRTAPLHATRDNQAPSGATRDSAAPSVVAGRSAALSGAARRAAASKVQRARRRRGKIARPWRPPLRRTPARVCSRSGPRPTPRLRRAQPLQALWRPGRSALRSSCRHKTSCSAAAGAGTGGCRTRGRRGRGAGTGGRANVHGGPLLAARMEAVAAKEQRSARGGGAPAGAAGAVEHVRSKAAASIAGGDTCSTPRRGIPAGAPDGSGRGSGSGSSSPTGDASRAGSVAGGGSRGGTGCRGDGGRPPGGAPDGGGGGGTPASALPRPDLPGRPEALPAMAWFDERGNALTRIPVEYKPGVLPKTVVDGTSLTPLVNLQKMLPSLIRTKTAVKRLMMRPQGMWPTLPAAEDFDAEWVEQTVRRGRGVGHACGGDTVEGREASDQERLDWFFTRLAKFLELRRPSELAAELVSWCMRAGTPLRELVYAFNVAATNMLSADARQDQLCLFALLEILRQQYGSTSALWAAIDDEPSNYTTHLATYAHSSAPRAVDADCDSCISKYASHASNCADDDGCGSGELASPSSATARSGAARSGAASSGAARGSAALSGVAHSSAAPSGAAHGGAAHVDTAFAAIYFAAALVPCETAAPARVKQARRFYSHPAPATGAHLSLLLSSCGTYGRGAQRAHLSLSLLARTALSGAARGSAAPSAAPSGAAHDGAPASLSAHDAPTSLSAPSSAAAQPSAGACSNAAFYLCARSGSGACASNDASLLFCARFGSGARALSGALFCDAFGNASGDGRGPRATHSACVYCAFGDAHVGAHNFWRFHLTRFNFHLNSVNCNIYAQRRRHGLFRGCTGASIVPCAQRAPRPVWRRRAPRRTARASRRLSRLRSCRHLQPPHRTCVCAGIPAMRAAPASSVTPIDSERALGGDDAPGIERRRMRCHTATAAQHWQPAQLTILHHFQSTWHLFGPSAFQRGAHPLFHLHSSWRTEGVLIKRTSGGVLTRSSWNQGLGLRKGIVGSQDAALLQSRPWQRSATGALLAATSRASACSAAASNEHRRRALSSRRLGEPMTATTTAAAQCQPEGKVVSGTPRGGHGIVRAAGILTRTPDALAAHRSALWQPLSRWRRQIANKLLSASAPVGTLQIRTAYISSILPLTIPAAASAAIGRDRQGHYDLVAAGIPATASAATDPDAATL